MRLIALAAFLLISTPALAQTVRYAVVDNTTGLVVNVVEINPGDGSIAPPGCILVASPTGNIGDTWNGTAIVPKPVPPDPRLQQ